MRNLSIRSKILAGVLLTIVLGAAVVVVYLHQSYSSGLDVAAQESIGRSTSIWNVLYEDEEIELGMNAETIELLERLGEAAGEEYALLLLKEFLDHDVYEEQRARLGLADNWDERDEYAMVASTDPGSFDAVEYETAPTEVAGIGKVVGIENGACSETCHGGVAGGEGDFWGVTWSDDSRSRSHAVFPVGVEAGQLVGVIYAIDDISPEADAARESMTRTLFVIGITLAVAAFFISWLLDMLVFRRLGRMIVTLEDVSMTVAGGGSDVSFEPGNRNDEIGQFEQFFAQFLDLVSSVFQSLHDRERS